MLTNMGRKKKVVKQPEAPEVTGDVAIVEEWNNEKVPETKKKIDSVSTEFGREDLNALGRAVNELIAIHNGKQQETGSKESAQIQSEKCGTENLRRSVLLMVEL